MEAHSLKNGGALWKEWRVKVHQGSTKRHAVRKKSAPKQNMSYIILQGRQIHPQPRTHGDIHLQPITGRLTIVPQLCYEFQLSQVVTTNIQ